MPNHKHISCSDVVPGCPFTAEADTEKELLDKVAEHAKVAHGVDKVSPDLADKVRKAIRTE